MGGFANDLKNRESVPVNILPYTVYTAITLLAIYSFSYMAS